MSVAQIALSLVLFAAGPLGFLVVVPSPFMTEGWIQVLGSLAHVGQDAFAQDWVRDVRSGPTRGEPLVAPLAGRVIAAGKTRSGLGNIVVLRSPAGLSILFAHLEDVFVRVGEVVSPSDTLIGSVGSSSASGGSAGLKPLGRIVPHLHIAVYRTDSLGVIADAGSVPFVLITTGNVPVKFESRRDLPPKSPRIGTLLPEMSGAS